MTDDPDTQLRAARPMDPEDEAMDNLLSRIRHRVDAERHGQEPRRRLRPRTRLALVAAAAALLTAVPVVISVVGPDDGGTPSVLPVAVAGNGELVCGLGYTTIVQPAQAEVRLLPDELPDGWSYTEIFARHDRADGCDSQSLVALRLDPDGVVTGRVAVSGPVDASVNNQVINRDSVPDTLFGNPARRFDYSPATTPTLTSEVHRWFWSDSAGRQWSAEVMGFGLDEARRQLTGVSISGDDVGWQPVDPGWTLVHLRSGAPYVVPTGGTTWTVNLTGGVEGRGFDVYSSPGPGLPVAVDAQVGDRVVDLGGHTAVVSPARGGEADGGAPGSSPLVTIALEVEPGIIALTRIEADDLDAVEQMLVSLRQVAPDDPRIESYGTE